MAKKYILLFSLGLLVGVGGTLIFMLKAPTKISSPDGTVVDSVSPTPTDTSAINCPVCQTCDEVAAKNSKLPAPEFADDVKEYIANDEGEVMIKFKPVKGAVKSRVTVVDGRDGRVRTFATKRNWVVIKDIPVPPDLKTVSYGVVLSSMNLLGQEGDFGEKRKITLKGRPELTAPTIKAITIED